jgi:hypothetical protein
MKILLLTTVCMVCGAMSATNEDSARLYEHLLKTYEPRVRPVRNHSTTIRVDVDFFITLIQELDERTHVFGLAVG